MAEDSLPGELDGGNGRDPADWSGGPDGTGHRRQGRGRERRVPRGTKNFIFLIPENDPFSLWSSLTLSQEGTGIDLITMSLQWKRRGLGVRECGKASARREPESHREQLARPRGWPPGVQPGLGGHLYGRCTTTSFALYSKRSHRRSTPPSGTSHVGARHSRIGVTDVN